jgi:hypothetical protein
MNASATLLAGAGAVALLHCAAALPAAAGDSPRRVTAVRTADAPVLDGRLTEPAWTTAPPGGGFMQYDPDEGAPATESTVVRILYDDRALYVGVECHDSDPAGIVRQLTRRDRSSEADRFTIQIDSYHDRKTAFVFSTNVARVQSDGVLSQDGMVYDVQWDAVWDVATAVDERGWVAEFAIPFNALRFAHIEGGEQVWGVNFRRYISRKHETVEWVLIPRSERAAISRWGTLHGIRDITPPLRLEVVPYASGSIGFRTATPSRPADNDLEARAGVDVKLGLSESTTLDAAVNPDFGQVEVDQAVVNLTVFETLFPEKRPFFTESASLFTFGPAADNSTLPLFFSRRVGKRPSRYFEAAGPAESNPAATTILAAAKLSGRTASGLSFGALAAATDEETAEIRLPDGTTGTLRTEPRGAASVARVRQDLSPTSWMGAILTALARADTLPAFSGGLDWNLRPGDGSVAVDGFLAGTMAATAESRSGAAGRLLIARISDQHWFPAASYDAQSRSFNNNDLGFFAQPREHGGLLQVNYRENLNEEVLRRFTAGISHEARWSWDGPRTVSALSAALTAELRSFWTGSLTWRLDLPAHDEAERGVIGFHRRPTANEAGLTVRTDERRPLVVSASVTGLSDAAGKRGWRGSLSVTARPVPWIELVPFAGYDNIRRERTAVILGGAAETVLMNGAAATLFGDRDIEQLNLALRGTVTFTPDLSVQFFGQLLAARGIWTELRPLAGGEEFGPPVADSYEFNIGILNANVLLRWEYLPGSALYLVWTQGRLGDTGDFTVGPTGRFGEVFRLPHTDVLFLKTTYRLPF